MRVAFWGGPLDGQKVNIAADVQLFVYQHGETGRTTYNDYDHHLGSPWDLLGHYSFGMSGNDQARLRWMPLSTMNA